MAQSNITFEQATEMMLGWYHQMRVDHLLEDELIFELYMRSIVIRDDPSYSRRRRSLREHLKIEKTDKKVLDVVLEPEFIEDIGLCERKYQEIGEILKRTDMSAKEKCKARLLHLSHRLFQMRINCDDTVELAHQLRDLMVKCVQLLCDSFYTNPNDQPSPADGDNEAGLPLVDLFALPPQPSGEQNERSEVGNLNNAPTESAKDRELVLTLQAHIRQLENRLALLEVANSTAVNNARRDPPVFVSRSGGKQTTVDDTVRSNCNQTSFNSIPNSMNPGLSHFSRGGLNVPAQPTDSSSNHFQAPPQLPPSWPYTMPQIPQALENQYPTLNATSRLANSNSNPGPVFNPVQNSFNVGPSAHRTLPVSRWNLTKYDGEDQGLKLNEFLEVVHALSLAEHVSETELFESAVHLFTGHALKWYMTMRTTGRLLNWPHLIMELKRTFMHPDLDALIKMKIYQRRQQRNESFNQFYFEMERLFRTMSNQIPDYEKMQILLQNMRIDYKKQLNFLPLTDLDTLVAAGQKIDALNFSAYNKVFGSEQHTNAVSVYETKSITKKSDQSIQNSKVTPSQSDNRNRNKNSPKQNPATAHSLANPPQIHSQASVSASKNPSSHLLTLTALIDSHRPPPANTCFNCGMQGHRMNMCRLPRGVLCENCGFRGYPTNNCPYCIKNAMSASQNRGPLSH